MEGMDHCLTTDMQVGGDLKLQTDNYYVVRG